MKRCFSFVLVFSLFAAFLTGCETKNILTHNNEQAPATADNESSDEKEPYESYLEQIAEHKMQDIFTLDMDDVWHENQSYSYKADGTERTLPLQSDFSGSENSVTVHEWVDIPKDAGTYELGNAGSISDGFYNIQTHLEDKDRCTLIYSAGRYDTEFEYTSGDNDHEIRLYRYDPLFNGIIINFPQVQCSQKIGIVSEENKIILTADPVMAVDITAFVPGGKEGSSLYADIDISEEPTVIYGTDELKVGMDQGSNRKEGLRVHIECQGSGYSEVFYTEKGTKLTAPPDEIEYKYGYMTRVSKWQLCNDEKPKWNGNGVAAYKDWDFENDTVTEDVRIIASYEVDEEKSRQYLIDKLEEIEDLLYDTGDYTEEQLNERESQKKHLRQEREGVRFYTLCAEYDEKLDDLELLGN